MSGHTMILRLAQPTVNPYVHISGVARSFARGPRHTSSWGLHSFNISVTVEGSRGECVSPVLRAFAGEARGA